MSVIASPRKNMSKVHFKETDELLTTDIVYTVCIFKATCRLICEFDFREIEKALLEIVEKWKVIILSFNADMFMVQSIM